MADDVVEPPGPQDSDVTRRTWLAAERTWLAWWRTALGGAAVSVAVGRGLPFVSKGARWPFELLGIGYGLLAMLVLIAGALRQRDTARELRRGGYSELATPLVLWMTAGALVLTVATLVIIATDL
jgi:putative membrane protein